MIPAYWYSTLGLYLWQVNVHSPVIAIIAYSWAEPENRATTIALAFGAGFFSHLDGD